MSLTGMEWGTPPGCGPLPQRELCSCPPELGVAVGLAVSVRCEKGCSAPSAMSLLHSQETGKGPGRGYCQPWSPNEDDLEENHTQPTAEWRSFVPTASLTLCCLARGWWERVSQVPGWGSAGHVWGPALSPAWMGTGRCVQPGERRRKEAEAWPGRWGSNRLSGGL